MVDLESEVSINVDGKPATNPAWFARSITYKPPTQIKGSKPADKMAQLVSKNEAKSAGMELEEIGRSIRSSFQFAASSFRRSFSSSIKDDDEDELKWAAIERLPTFERIRKSLFDQYIDQNGDGRQKEKNVIDVTKLGALERRVFIENLIKHIENDNLRLLQKQRERIDRVNVKLPTIEVRYKNLCVEAVCVVVQGKPLPTLWNAVKCKFSVKLSVEQDLAKLPGLKSEEATISILRDIGCGKTTLLLALAGKLDKSLKVGGEVSYNGFGLEEFVPEKTSAYISQYDLHIPEMTVREILDFSARFQGVGSRADTMVGDVMRRGISGGEKKRLTTGEMIVGPMKALFMDEISTGLDSSTTFQIVTCLQQFAHITESTVVISLLQPASETYNLFDDIILMAEGKVVYHGPRSDILNFFEECGFRCPERKGAADFLQEVLSRKDQEQYWSRQDECYRYVSVDQFVEKFKTHHIGQNLDEELSKPYDKSQCHKNALSFNTYSLSKWELLKACTARELLLMKRNWFIYIFKTIQLAMAAVVAMTVILRTRMEIDMAYSSYYLGSLFFGLLLFMVNGIPQLSLQASRLPIFYKQRDFYFYPAWAYAIPACILKIPISLIESLVWTSLTYYVIGYSPEAARFFRQLLLFFLVHQISLSLYHFIASYFQTIVTSTIIASIPGWLKWGFWVSPLTYAEIGLAVNEFLAPRWQKTSSANITTMGHQVLTSRGLNYNGYLYWISAGALLGFILLFNTAFTLALTYRRSIGASRAIISREKLSQIQGDLTSPTDLTNISPVAPSPTTSEPKTGKTICPIFSARPKDIICRNVSRKWNQKYHTGRMVLPFIPLTVAFLDVQYYVDTPQEMREQGYTEKRLQLLHNITGAFRPGVLSALMGVSGAGKTTLLDVLSGRKTGGMVEGDIRIGGYPKVQETFARISGYCEQTDIHSPQITIEESVIYSAWLRLPPQVDPKTRSEFVSEVLEVIELDGIKDALVGIPGVSGLSTEQRKRLTIAVELVSNPSIIFMDEPTSGLDARAAAIVMRAVKNIAETGRTVVCTIHQPSIEIFEAFDESVPGVPKIKDNYNPATWMLEVTSTSSEVQLGFIGINNCSSVKPFVATERAVVYRENFAGMYSPWAYSFAQVVIEIPYVFLQVVLFAIITYPAIGYYWTAYKFLWFLYTMFCTLLYFVYLGMFLVSLTPNVQFAYILASFFYTLLSLFSGFIVPAPVSFPFTFAY
ncbi:Pleiotropic drug resistance protein 3 [Cocos nucifera]|uniref:Pleiotropic drug resistance protein 3 n=1 Tax=Cocos nucifera TaxID=13894 RepID=A0A8K0HTY1_COCNU|nr:Pleiotropic drug resistance protein 3 [Cocos nucifera]